MRITRAKTLSVLLVVALVVISTPIDSQAAKKPKMSKTKVNLTQGNSKKLSVKNKKGYTITWKSNKKSVVSVSKSGTIRAKKKGRAKIFAIARNKTTNKSRKLSCQVVVKGKASQGMTASANKVVPSAETKTDVTPKPDAIVTSFPKDILDAIEPKPDAIATSFPKDIQDTVEPKPEYISVNPVTTENTKVLYSREIGSSHLYARDVLGNQIVDSYEQLQTLIQCAKEEVAGDLELGYWSDNTRELTDIIRQLETIDRDYFTENVLCIGTLDKGQRGYNFEVKAAAVKETSQGDRILDILFDEYWAVPDGMCVTCDLVYYSCLIQMPRDAVQGCQSLVCGLSSE